MLKPFQAPSKAVIRDDEIVIETRAIFASLALGISGKEECPHKCSTGDIVRNSVNNALVTIDESLEAIIRR